MPRFRFCIFFAFLVACEDFPQLDEAISDRARQSAYPSLEPVDELLPQAEDASNREAAAEIENPQDRAKLLKARAKVLRRTYIIDPDAQARMKAAFDRLTQ